MEERTYTAAQIYDSMIRQGFDEESARIMAMAVGDKRITQDQLRAGYQKLGISGAKAPEGNDGKQDSNLIPNLAEGIGFAAGVPLANKYIPKKPEQTGFMAPIAKFGRGAARLAVPPALAALGSYGTQALTGNNYYDRATQEQLVADMAGSLAGAYAGEKLGAKYAERAANAISRAAENQAANNLGSRLIGKAASSTVGRGLGTALGAAGGPIGSLVLGTALGYLLPKLMPGAPKSVKEENDKRRNAWSWYEDPF